MDGFETTGSMSYQFPVNPLDLAEAVLMDNCPRIEFDLEHIFTPGLYSRKITMKAGSVICSRIHNTDHPFFVLTGMVSVWTDEDGEMIFRAGHCGITKAGTRRVLYVHETCTWVTCHVCQDGETVEDIEARILAQHFNPHVGMTHAEMSRTHPSFLNGKFLNPPNHDRILSVE